MMMLRLSMGFFCCLVSILKCEIVIVCDVNMIFLLV